MVKTKTKIVVTDELLYDYTGDNFNPRIINFREALQFRMEKFYFTNKSLNDLLACIGYDEELDRDKLNEHLHKESKVLVFEVQNLHGKKIVQKVEEV